MVLWSRQQWKAIKILASKFELDFPQDNRLYHFGYPYDFLEVLEGKLQGILAKGGEEYFYEIDDEIGWAVKQLTYSELASMSYGIDYNLELRRESPLVSEENYPVVFFCLVALPKIKDEGLVSENHGHGMGYHIHYVVMQKKKQKRTNIVFTFNPSEISISQHVLYWERHGSGLSRKPHRFGKRRRNAIYDTSCGFLSKVPKIEFRAPVSAANVLWPQ